MYNIRVFVLFLMVLFVGCSNLGKRRLNRIKKKHYVFNNLLVSPVKVGCHEFNYLHSISSGMVFYSEKPYTTMPVINMPFKEIAKSCYVLSVLMTLKVSEQNKTNDSRQIILARLMTSSEYCILFDYQKSIGLETMKMNINSQNEIFYDGPASVFEYSDINGLRQLEVNLPEITLDRKLFYVTDSLDCGNQDVCIDSTKFGYGFRFILDPFEAKINWSSNDIKEQLIRIIQAETLKRFEIDSLDFPVLILKNN